MRSRWAMVAGGTMLAAVLCLTGLGAAFCESTLKVPRWQATDPPDANVVGIRADDGVALSGAWFRGTMAGGSCVILLHGIGDTREGVKGFARMFQGQGYGVLTPDSRAHGSCDGELVTYGLLEKHDAIAWTHWMREQGCQKIYGLGESLGASVLIQAAAVEPAFAAIAAESPFADLMEVGEYRLRMQLGLPAMIGSPLAELVLASGRLYARVADHLDFAEVNPLWSIAHSETPVLLIHGLSDSRTPPEQSQKLLAANPRNSLWLVPGAEHVRASVVAPEEFRRRVLEWFAAH